MNNIRKYTAWLGAGAVMITLATGCAGPNDETAIGNVAESGVEATGNVLESGAEATANVATSAVDATGNVIAPVGQAIDNSVTAAGSNLEALGDAATYTPKIKTALGANAGMKGSSVNVDTMGEKNQIALSGSVMSNEQKTLAEAIAKKNAPGYVIVNQLVVKGKM